MTLVAGIDSSTQSCKVEVRDLATGVLVRSGKASHPKATIVDPECWWDALLLAVDRAGGLDGVSALSVAGQQHTPVFLDADGRVVRDSPLWNDTGSHPHMEALNAELGAGEWIRRTGLPITISDTVVKLRWLRDTDPVSAARTRAVAVVHDWLTWRLLGHGETGRLDALVTDRSDASGTGYWSGETEAYCMDLLELALGKSALVPRVLGPLETAGVTAGARPGIPEGIVVAPGSGDNAAAALALQLQAGEAVMSLGTSGVIYGRSHAPVRDYSGVVCSYADGTGEHQPIAASLSAARTLDAAVALLDCSHDELSSLALRAPAGAGGLTLLPFFEGERTPNLPDARGSVHGASLTNFTPANLARAAIEGMIATQMEMVEAFRRCRVPMHRLFLIGGGARLAAVQQVVAQVVGLPLVVPEPGEYVARGAAVQAGGALTGEFANWRPVLHEVARETPQPVVIAQHRAAKAALGYDATMPAQSLTA